MPNTKYTRYTYGHPLVTFRTTPEGTIALRDAARRDGMTVSELIRDRLRDLLV